MMTNGSIVSAIKQAAHALDEGVKDLLYQHIDPVVKQWIKNFNSLVQIGTELLGRLYGVEHAQPVSILNHTFSDTELQLLAEGRETDLISGLVGKSGKSFSAFIRQDGEGNLAFRFPQSPSAPRQQGIVVPSFTAKALETPVFGKKLSQEEIDRLLAGGRSPVLTGFISKSGKPFDAALEIAGEKLIIHIPERLINTHIKGVPNEFLGTLLSPSDRQLLLGGKQTSLIKGMVTHEGIKFNGFIAPDANQHLWVKSEAVKKEIDLHLGTP